MTSTEPPLPTIAIRGPLLVAVRAFRSLKIVVLGDCRRRRLGIHVGIVVVAGGGGVVRRVGFDEIGTEGMAIDRGGGNQSARA